MDSSGVVASQGPKVPTTRLHGRCRIHFSAMGVSRQGDSRVGFRKRLAQVVDSFLVVPKLGIPFGVPLWLDLNRLIPSHNTFCISDLTRRHRVNCG